MDRTTQKNQEIERLIRAGDQARSSLTGEVIALRARLDVPARIRLSLKSHPFAWLFGSIASGLVVSLLFRRKPARVEKAPRAVSLTILGLILTVIRPMMKVWLTDQLKNYLTSQLQGRAAGHPVARKYVSSNPF